MIAFFLHTICNDLILPPLFEQKWILIVLMITDKINRERPRLLCSQSAPPNPNDVTAPAPGSKVSVSGTTFINLSRFSYSGLRRNWAAGANFSIYQLYPKTRITLVVKSSGIRSHPDLRCCPRACWLTAATIFRTSKRKWVQVEEGDAEVGSWTTGQLLRRFGKVKYEQRSNRSLPWWIWWGHVTSASTRVWKSFW